VNEKIIVYKNDLKDITQKILNEEKESIEDLSKSIKKLQDEAKDIV
jgi:bacterioferritin (cytochrome b1)